MGKASGVTTCHTGYVGVRVLWAKRFLTGVVAALFLSAGTGIALGQAQNTGSIFGSVTDPSGAQVPNATITAAETSKGISRSVKSSSNGEYLVPNLPIGTYILTVAAPTFETYVAAGITVDADKSVKIVAKLVVGNANETVSVDAEGTALDTRSATLGTLIDNKLVEDLPIDGRNTVALAGLLPGVTDLNAPATNTSDRGGPTYSVSGSRNTQNLMLFDGLMWNNLFFNTGINYPPPNSLQEVSVLTNNFKAQYGRNAGSVFNVQTKRGTNQLHGAVWDYFQNQIFNASDYLSQRNPKDISNQFGFTVGGPIKKDKIFFFLAFQDLIQKLQAVGTAPVQGYAERGLNVDGTPRLCTPGPYAPGTTCASYATDVFTFTTTAPTATNGVTATPSGNVTYGRFNNPETQVSTSGLQAQPSDAESMFNSAWIQSGHTGTNPCIDLLRQAGQYAATHTYFGQAISTTTQNNLPFAEYPTACMNPVMTNVLNTYVPLPNARIVSSSNPLGYIPGLISVSPQPKNDRNVLVRADWIASARHTIDARYNLINADDATAPGVNSASVGVATFEVSANHALSHFGNIGDNWVITPNLLNALRVGYKRYVFSAPPSDHHTLNDFGGNFVVPGVPVLPVFGASGAYTLGSTSQGNSNVVNENIELLDQLSWSRGKHNFQFGANFLRLQYLNNTNYPGLLSFSSTFTGQALADEQLGLLTSVRANSLLVQGGINHSVFTYVQDDWRLTSKLTLNLGARYELPFQWYQPNGYSSTFIPGHQSTRFPGAIGGLAFPGDPGVLSSLVPTDFNGIVPRFGFAYDVFGSGRLAIRGGFGMFFDAINANVIGVGEPFYFQFFHNLPPGGASVPLASYGPNGGVAQIPGAYDKNNPQFTAPYSLFYPDRNFRTPYYEAINFGFQLRIGRQGVLEPNYVGKFGRKLTIPFDQNPAITDCTGGYYQSNPALYGNPSCPYLAGTPAGGASSTVQSTQARLRYTPFNYGGAGLVDFASIGTSNYNSLQVQYTQRGGRLLTLITSYTYSKSIDLQTDSQSTTNAIPNVFNISSERGVSDYDAPHILNMGWVLNPPRITTGSSLMRSVLNNWTYGGTFNAHSGRPFNVVINNDTALSGEPNQRASLIPGMSPTLPASRHRSEKVKQYFNIYAFTYPTLGTYSNMQRNSLRGPGYIMTNMNLGRSFPLAAIREGMRMQFRAEAFNVFNTPNLANPKASFSCSTTSISTPPASAGATSNFGKSCTDASVGGTLNTTFGTIASTFGNNANTSTNGRKMQFSLTVFY